MSKTLLLALFVLFLGACGKKNTPAVENESIVGKWKLTESLSDPGDGSGKWTPADPNHPIFLEFRPDGIAASTGSASTGYKLLNDSTILFTTDAGDIPLRYHLTKTTLSLTPPCIEACGMHYIAVK